MFTYIRYGVSFMAAVIYETALMPYYEITRIYVRSTYTATDIDQHINRFV